MAERVAVIRRVRGKRLPEGAVYVGRPSMWGNPFVIGRDGTREEVIAKYRAGLAALDPLVLAVRLGQLADRNPTALACWCAPSACHADVLAELLAVRAPASGAAFEAHESTRPTESPTSKGQI